VRQRTDARAESAYAVPVAVWLRMGIAMSFGTIQLIFDVPVVLHRGKA